MHVVRSDLWHINIEILTCPSIKYALRMIHCKRFWYSGLDVGKGDMAFDS